MKKKQGGFKLGTKRLEKHIKRFLQDGPHNTIEILDHINKSTKHGTTVNTLTNVLGKNKSCFRVTGTEFGGRSLKARKIIIWSLT